MKTITTIILTAIISIATTYFITSTIEQKKYNKYIFASEMLLWEIEEFNEDNNLYWGDTICEGDAWSDYNEVRIELGLDYLEYYQYAR